MRRIRDVQGMMRAIEQSRPPASRCTNLYLSGEETRRLAEVSLLQVWEDDAGCYAIKLEHETYARVYFQTRAAADLRAAMSAIVSTHEGTLVADIITRAREQDAAVDALHRSGFETHRMFQRMQVAGPVPSGHAVLQPEVTHAEALDAKALEKCLASEFDPLSERLPARDELARAALNSNIIVTRHQGAIQSLLFHERTGGTSHMRMLWVDPSARGTGLGGALLKHYFNLSDSIQRFILWVDCSNTRAIDLYSRFGYSQDGLYDLIMLKRRSRP